MCEVFPEPSAEVYQYKSTTDLEFMIRSKSALVPGLSKVDGGLNKILSISNTNDFNEINSHIVGYNLIDPSGMTNPVDMELEAKDRFNRGSAVNPYDRFGMAGLHWTGYMGEWRHVVIDACAENPEPSDPKAGVFYEERLEPRSVWADIEDSKDPRTQIFNKSFPPVGDAFANVAANWIFGITKAIVALTMLFVGVAFSNIVSILGIDKFLGMDGGGLLGALFGSIFLPLIGLVFAAIGIRILYLFSRAKVRQSITELIRSLVLYLMAIVVMVAPGPIIALPNTFAVVVQSILLSTMNQGLTGGGGLCSTNIGSFEGQILDDQVSVDGAIDNTEQTQDIIAQAGTNIQSALGCQLWQMLLVKPWSQGQYGVDWNQMWAKGEIAEWAPEGAAEVKNNDKNAEMVGDASVPMGGGTFINNWALFQISTQTNAHAAIGHEGEPSKYTSGVANDWWRIVDMLSNYEETEIEVANSAVLDGPSSTYMVPSDNIAVSERWPTWTGQNVSERVWIALSSVLISLVSVSGVLFFAALSAIYSLGITILMAFSPIVFLIGSWPGKGWEVFKGWLELLSLSLAKRISAGILMVLSIVFTSTALRVMETTTWIQGVLLLIVSMLALIKGREVLFRSFTSFRFASHSLTGTADRVANSSKKIGSVLVNKPISASTKAAGSLAGGVVAGVRNGTGWRDGLNKGLKNELQNINYRNANNRHFRSMMVQYEIQKHRSGQSNLLDEQKRCAQCNSPLVDPMLNAGVHLFHGGRDRSGKLICESCLNGQSNRDLFEEVTMNIVTDKNGERSLSEKIRLDTERCQDCGGSVVGGMDKTFKGGRDRKTNQLICSSCMQDRINNDKLGGFTKMKTPILTTGSEKFIAPDAITPEQRELFFRNEKKKYKTAQKQASKDEKERKSANRQEVRANAKGEISDLQAQRIIHAYDAAHTSATMGDKQKDFERKLVRAKTMLKNANTPREKAKATEKVQKAYMGLINGVAVDIDTYKNSPGSVPTVPPSLEEYVNKEKLAAAWVTEDYNEVMVQYIIAYYAKFSEDLDDVLTDDFLLQVYQDKINATNGGTP